MLGNVRDRGMRRVSRFFGSVLLSVAVITLLAGCVEQPLLPRVRVNQPFWVKVEHRVLVEDLELTFLAVVEDSRCPIDVICVWEGNAQVELALKARNASRVQMVLHSNLAPTELEYAGYRVRYLNLEPRPCTRCRLNPKEYKLKLIVSRSAQP